MNCNLLFKSLASVFCITVMTTSCTSAQDSLNKEAIERANAFADSYFNFRFDECMEHCTPRSHKWISFYASNITENDIKVVTSALNGASVNCENFEYTEQDSCATIDCMVYNGLNCDSLEHTGRIVEEQRFRISMRLTNDNKWKVDLNAPISPIQE